MDNKIIGAIDNSRMFNIFGGWARYANGVDRERLMASAFYQGEMIAQAFAISMRGNDKCGFTIDLGREVDIDDLRSGRLRIYAGEQTVRTELPFHQSMLETFEARCLGKGLSMSGDDVIRHFIGGLTLGAQSAYLKYLSKAWECCNKTSQSRTLDDVRLSEPATCLISVGQTSPDGVAVVGEDGHLFILGGSNSLIEAYRVSRDDSALQELAKQWITLFGCRKKAISAFGAKYLQLTIPDKSSILADKFPIKITPPTSLLWAIHEQLKDDSFVSDDYLNSLELFWSDRSKEELYQKTDSHLAPYGCRKLITEIIRVIGLDVDLETDFSVRKLNQGDLGSKYTGSPLLQYLKLPRKEDFARLEKHLVQAETYVPADGKNGGARIKWVNRGALVDKCVVAFANSFFERGGGATALSWWAARCFREFHFLWDSSIVPSYIDSVRPDVVICQTAERFLRRLPDQ